MRKFNAVAIVIAIVLAFTAVPAFAGKKKSKAQTGIEWSVAPARVQIFLDGKKLGDAGTLKFTPTKPGRHTIRLVNGEDETEMDIGIKKGQRLKFEFVFDES